MTTREVVPRRRVVAVLLWAGTAVVGLGIGVAGAAKFVTGMWQPLFAGWGYPPRFVAVVGAIEILGCVGLFVPRAAFYAAVSLALIMLGAFITLQMHPGGPLGWGATPLFYLVVLGAIAVLRWRERYALRRSLAV
jgi:uncharacterized membrane protein YphA (DoxX/SURF4 family)